ncbi:hypothetical protein GGX14DRAFT_555446 [Mycena pura]|uniref:Uncharacterized protein n=1 Tax=Mycena pura TaxID=153505 RepID=A0AAD6YQV8_9AGAR|nr:hypothetical protein GGX14DRAFT_555446 [Mycena pura]
MSAAVDAQHNSAHERRAPLAGAPVHALPRGICGGNRPVAPHDEAAAPQRAAGPQRWTAQHAGGVWRAALAGARAHTLPYRAYGQTRSSRTQMRRRPDPTAADAQRHHQGALHNNAGEHSCACGPGCTPGRGGGAVPTHGGTTPTLRNNASVFSPALAGMRARITTRRARRLRDPTRRQRRSETRRHHPDGLRNNTRVRKPAPALAGTRARSPHRARRANPGAARPNEAAATRRPDARRPTPTHCVTMRACRALRLLGRLCAPSPVLRVTVITPAVPPDLRWSAASNNTGTALPATCARTSPILRMSRKSSYPGGAAILMRAGTIGYVRLVQYGS